MRSFALFFSALFATLSLAPQAEADTAFGGDPAQAITPGLSCSLGAPSLIPTGTVGSPSCMWTWNSIGAGTDLVPIPATGGAGTITSVTLPAMPNPGPMEVVVLTVGLVATTSPTVPDSVCCQVKQVGPTFTVPPNQITTVAQNLRVSASEGANLNAPGEAAFSDMLAISVKSPTASLPIRFTGNTDVSNFDGAYAYYPAPSGPSGEFRQPYNAPGFRVLARFNFAPDGPGGGVAGPASGVRLRRAGRVAANGRTVGVGSATNPPVARTAQTLTALPARNARASAARPVVLARGKTKVPSGRSKPVKLNLNRKGKARLARAGKLRATLTVVAVNAQGEKQRKKKTVTIRPRSK